MKGRSARIKRVCKAQQEREGGDTEPAESEVEAKLAETSRRGLKARGKQAEGASAWGDEEVWWEGAPALGDVITNVVMAISLVWLPLTLAAVGRYFFVRYRVTDKRVSVTTNAPWKKEQLDAAYPQVDDVTAIGRGLGFWGDMLITLKDGSKVELRSVPRFREVESYIDERVASMAPPSTPQDEAGSKKGFKPPSRS